MEIDNPKIIYEPFVVFVETICKGDWKLLVW
jgi:hypothetical protein